MLELLAEDGDFVFYNRTGQPVSEAMTSEQAIANLRGENVKKETKR